MFKLKLLRWIRIVQPTLFNFINISGNTCSFSFEALERVGRKEFLIFLILIIALGSSTTASTQPIMGKSRQTNLYSIVDRVISYRFQEHMWHTEDGGVHLIFNRGAESSNGTLELSSSYDNGITWQSQLFLTNSGIESTSDGLLAGNDLHVVYSDRYDGIIYSTLRYDSLQRVWILVPDSAQRVFWQSTTKALNPALVVDHNGAIWCNYVTQDLNTLNAAIRLSQRAPDSSEWSDTGHIFGSVDNVGIQRSARPLLLPDGIGMIFTVYEKIYWAVRRDNWPIEESWDIETIFISAPPFDLDPFGGHFSIVADNQDNLHLITPDHGRALYFRFDALTQVWEAPREISGASFVGYVQATRSDDTILLTTNSRLNAQVYQSIDNGRSFELTHRLIHPLPPADGSISYSPPRIETPGISPGPMPVLQQYSEGSLQRLMQFSVRVK